MWSKVDGKVFSSSINDEEYMKIKQSLNIIEELRDLHINVSKTNLKDTDKRWDFDNKNKLKIFSNNSNTAFMIVAFTVVGLCYLK